MLRRNTIIFLQIIMLFTIVSCLVANKTPIVGNNDPLSLPENNKVDSQTPVPEVIATQSLLDSLKFSPNIPQSGTIIDITFSPDGTLLLLTTNKGVGLYLSSDFSQVWYSQYEVPGIPRFLPDGTKMVASQYLSQDDLFYIYILNTINGEVIRKFPVVNKMGLVEPFSDGSNIFTDDRNGNISIFNLETKTYFTSQTDDGCAIFHIKMTKNNKAITASCDYLDIWNSNAEKICSLSIDELWPTNQDSDNSIQSISLLDDEKTALILRKNFPEGDTIEIIDVCGKSILNSMAIGDYRTSSVMDVSNQGDNPFIALVSENTLKFIQFNNFGTFYLEKNLPTTDVYFVDYSIIKISPSSDRILLADRRNGILLLLDANGNTIKLLDGFDS